MSLPEITEERFFWGAYLSVFPNCPGLSPGIWPEFSAENQICFFQDVSEMNAGGRKVCFAEHGMLLH